MQKYTSFNAFFLSLFLHSIIFTVIFYSPFSPQSKKDQGQTSRIEIIPQQNKTREQLAQNYNINHKKPLPYQEDMLDRLLTPGRSRPTLAKTPQINQKIKTISLSNLTNEQELEKSPAYMEYYRLIREAIRRKAYQNYNGKWQGKVYLSFSIAKNGSLQKVEFAPQSAAETTLRQIAFNSLKDSSPFPPFPDELSDYSNLQFDISIYFKSN